MSQTFKDRLKILMKGERPYTWANKVNIEKGLFQYYWQKEKIPTSQNLIKIQKYTGCSLDWLLTGNSVAFDKIDSLPMVKGKKPKYGQRNLRLAKAIENLTNLYTNKSNEDIKVVEYIIDKILKSKK